MSDGVMQFLVQSGGGPVDEILARVRARPHTIADTLLNHLEHGCVDVTGPKNLNDFADLIEAVRQQNGYDGGDETYQRSAILREIGRHQTGFMHTIVRPTRRGLARALR